MPAHVKEEDLIEFDWLKLENDMNQLHPFESRTEKLFRKMRENPFVPIGALATTAALVTGLWSFRLGKKRLSQLMMRTRVVAQGFTIFAMVLGVGMGASKVAQSDKPNQ